ncbi:MAG TPA: gliding motility-associated C-terminal domain-containing protein [Fluviicola sp.]|nr:gliding motility-associated C-terminal domain-containing protein [Fluviicola sp.]
MAAKFFFTATAVLTSVTQLSAQFCQGSVVPPATVNGIELTSTFDGSVFTFETAYTSCGSYSTPANSVWLGSTGDFSYTVYFSQPVNNVSFVINAAGQLIDEIFIFTTNTGIPNITDVSSCYSSVSGNVVTSGLNADPASLGGGGIFTVTNSSDYTSVTITGPGGSAGSLMAICADVQPSGPVSPCKFYSDLDHLDIPNVITPDGDGINDELLIDEVYTSCYSHEITIFNRWGNLVFQGTEATVPFSGIDLNGEKLSQGVYFYSFKSNNQEKSGYFSIF